MTAKRRETSEVSARSGPKLWVVLARAYGALAAFVEAAVTEEGLCLSDFMVLEVLLHKGPMTISGIGEKVLLANASMTAAVDRLEKLGFVARHHSAEDGRVRVVDLTRTGRPFIAELYQRHASQIETVMGVLSSEERAMMRDSLKKLGLAAQGALEESSGAGMAPREAARPVRRKTTAK